MRPLLSVAEKNDKFFVSAEIPGIDIAERPCYYKGKGRLKGSYVRVGVIKMTIPEKPRSQKQRFVRNHRQRS